MKTCQRCKQEKDYSHFSKKKASKDGFMNWCKDCQREWNAEYQQRAEVKQHRKEYYAQEDVKQRNRIHKKNWKRTNKVLVNAYERERRQRPDVKVRKQNYRKEYISRPEVMENRRRIQLKRYHRLAEGPGFTDEQWNLLVNYY